MALVTGEELATVLGLAYDPEDGDPGLDQVAAAADAVVTGLLTTIEDGHDDHPQCREAALSVAVEMYQARTAAGGQPVGLDYQPAPYRLSVWLTRRVAALTAGHGDVAGWVG